MDESNVRTVTGCYSQKEFDFLTDSFGPGSGCLPKPQPKKKTTFCSESLPPEKQGDEFSPPNPSELHTQSSQVFV